ncbi:MAG TPA: SDR family oxidoreductase [Pseudonocardia sp.]|jgi:NAD(P)H dehydrogenase (quinone)|nr:SDR family oxidoreductase [Pseudonocardia sp.]
MTTYAVTGTTGHLGPLVVRELLARGVPAADVVALARTPEKAADLGVPVRRADYSDTATLPEALAGVDVLLLVSGSEVGRRVAQHTAVVEAAKTAGVQRVAYTSIANADHSTNPLQPEHKATEDVLRASGLPFTIFRNNWYLENYTGQVPQYLATGEVLGIDGDARIGAATRADMAAATTAALLDEGTAGATFELSGPPITLAGLAEAVTDVTGTKVAYRDVTPEELTAILRGTGLDDGTAGFVVALEESVARGDLDVPGDDLERLLGRPATTLADALRADHR